jgi:hypothetical protein
MSEPDPAEWVTIIHPETGGTGEVHRASLPQHYASGWRLLSDDEAAAAGEPEPEPPPMTKAQAAKAAKAEQADEAGTSEEK